MTEREVADAQIAALQESIAATARRAKREADELRAQRDAAVEALTDALGAVEADDRDDAQFILASALLRVTGEGK